MTTGTVRPMFLPACQRSPAVVDRSSRSISSVTTNTTNRRIIMCVSAEELFFLCPAEIKNLKRSSFVLPYKGSI